MDNIIQIFIAQSHWIDVTIICGITLAFTFWIGMFDTLTLCKEKYTIQRRTQETPEKYLS